MRAVFALAVFLACAWFGARRRARLDARLSAIASFGADIRRLRDIMELSPMPVAEAAGRLKSEIWKRFLREVGEANARDAWERALDDSPEYDEDRELVAGFGDALRAGEMRAQLNALELIMREIEEKRLSLSAELEKKGKVYSSLGVLLGLSLALLVI